MTQLVPSYDSMAFGRDSEVFEVAYPSYGISIVYSFLLSDRMSYQTMPISIIAQIPSLQHKSSQPSLYPGRIDQAGEVLRYLRSPIQISCVHPRPTNQTHVSTDNSY